MILKSLLLASIVLTLFLILSIIIYYGNNILSKSTKNIDTNAISNSFIHL